MIELRGKKLLILGGSTIGCPEITEYAKNIGVYTIVADYLDAKWSKAKQIADEHWEISTADIDLLEKKSREAKIDGVIAGVSEFNIEKSIELCKRLHLPCYTSMKNWQYCTNKKLFKAMCKKHNVPVTEEYYVDWQNKDFSDVTFPAIVKPADSCASRGFCVCYDEKELEKAYEEALQFSASGEILIEKYMPYPASIIYYTAHKGKLHFAGITDKKSMKIKGKESLVMAIQLIPSQYTEDYISSLDKKVKDMFEKEGIHEGPIWIEAFNNEGEFTFNEMGYRFGGSLTYYPVEYFYGYNQMHMMVEYALTGKSTMQENTTLAKENYCIFPIHLKPGTIKTISGHEQVLNTDYVKALVPVHYQGDEIKDWGTAQQVYCYVHVTFTDMKELKERLQEIKDILHVGDADDREMLFFLFDIESL
ncbi:MAG: ATP-grasp domain-containing protein [Clostridia bacterium]|nr:ATP-grasp domain-containing protein [Clostridia bacterium]